MVLMWGQISLFHDSAEWNNEFINVNMKKKKVDLQWTLWELLYAIVTKKTALFIF